MRRLAHQFSVFLGVGVLAAIVHYGVLIALVEGFGAGAVPATLLGYLLGGVVSYALNRRHTYRTTRPHALAGSRFALVATVGFLLTWALMHALVERLGLPYLPAQLGTTGLVLGWSFLAHKWFSFGDGR